MDFLCCECLDRRRPFLPAGLGTSSPIARVGQEVPIEHNQRLLQLGSLSFKIAFELMEKFGDIDPLSLTDDQAP